MSIDLVLSSGFLAFAAQAGVLRAVEETGVEVDALCGTSSGALAGALWLAGMPAEQILERLTASVPLRHVRPSLRPWRGLFSMEPVMRELERDLPANMADLKRPFATGVIDRERKARLLTEGPLPACVAASCAIPRVFAPVEVHGVAYRDGGVVDRTGLTAWREARPGRTVVLHLVESTSGTPTTDDLSGVHVIRNPRSGAQFWSLGDTRMRFERARANARAVLDAL
jgi:NTE family protein